jgi:hypothetical protein
MPLSSPSHIASASLCQPEIRYVWRDWEENGVYDTPEDDTLLDRLEGLSFRANLALTIACAEWVIYRYECVADIQMHLQFIEAAWAAVVDDRYLRPWEPLDDECSGPVKGPLAASLMIIQEAVHAMATEAGNGLTAIYISNLASHVLPQIEAFMTWREQVLSGLESLAPLDPEETLGDVVPREYFAAPQRFKSEMAESFVRKFLQGLDVNSNPSLHTPEELEELHFEAVPYDFNLAQDRSNRREW